MSPTQARAAGNATGGFRSLTQAHRTMACAFYQQLEALAQLAISIALIRIFMESPRGVVKSVCSPTGMRGCELFPSSKLRARNNSHTGVSGSECEGEHLYERSSRMLSRAHRR